jgi:hypothetical protein
MRSASHFAELIAVELREDRNSTEQLLGSLTLQSP